MLQCCASKYNPQEKVDATTTFDEDNLIQAILDLFAAGTDTITATLSWALLFMVTHPDVQGEKSLCIEKQRLGGYQTVKIHI